MLVSPGKLLQSDRPVPVCPLLRAPPCGPKDVGLFGFAIIRCKLPIVMSRAPSTLVNAT
jgi:hypothetical protein